MLLHNKSFLTKIILIRRRGPTSKLNMSGGTPLCGGTPMLGTYPKTATTNVFLKRFLLLLVLCCVVSMSSYFLLRAAYVSGYLSQTTLLDVFPSFSVNFVTNRAGSLDRPEPMLVPPLTDRDEYKLARVLENAAMKDGTVILTTLNEAWAAPDSIFDLFLESFRIGDGTQRLLNHLVVVALDEKAFSRCLKVHKHCYALSSEGINFSKEAFFMSPDYLKMMWRRIKFLTSVLEMGYSFVFSDADVMWFRDPFPHFYSDADFQIACDRYTGSSFDLDNSPNGGFNFVRSNNRSIDFYKFWYSAQEIYPGFHDQDVLNAIKRDPRVSEIKLKMRFLDTAYFGGFCEPSKDFDRVCTMHANCCVGLGSKISDIKLMLNDWKKYLSIPHRFRKLIIPEWSVPRDCSVPSGQPQMGITEVMEKRRSNGTNNSSTM